MVRRLVEAVSVLALEDGLSFLLQGSKPLPRLSTACHFWQAEAVGIGHTSSPPPLGPYSKTVRGELWAVAVAGVACTLHIIHD